MVDLRPVGPEDWAAIAALHGRNTPAFMAERAVDIRCELAAVLFGGIVGYVSVSRMPWWGPGRFQARVLVDRALWGQGAGRRLASAALASAEANGAARLDSSVAEGDPRSLRFAERWGFRVERHLFGSSLDVAAFDEAPFAGVVDRVTAAGIRFFTMAEAGDTPEARAKLWALNRAVSLDIPGRERTFATLEDYIKRNCEAPWYRPGAQLIAAEGDRWVGLCSLQPLEDGSLFNRVTGVVPQARGRSLATALKVLGVRYARAHGFVLMRTNNDAANAPMLAINRKLGFVPAPGLYLLQRDL
ncbi:MAG TPA: GNAT family N-acetyltransferase [Symbiobacteriaceae bacterium]|nr:GNAT family N-acetyltransferase [Symbiobacteriaceae bacterium]